MAAMRAESSLDACSEQSDEHQDRHKDPLHVDDETRGRLEAEPPLREYLANKYKKDMRRHWDLFYKRNATNFFKDRHWLIHEFPLLLDPTAPDGSRPVLFEIGCGVGNTIFPVRRENPQLFVHACDLSQRAVAFVQEHEEYSGEDCHAFVCDLSVEDVTEHVPVETVDVVSAFFVLSAMSLEEMHHVVCNIRKVLKVGGVVIFRDYAIYDHAMLRFKKGHKLSSQLYVRQDGTRAFYFTKEQVAELFSKEHGFEADDVTYIYRDTVNVKEQINVPRAFVQACFRKVSSEQ